jgi:hypothetical protein
VIKILSALFLLVLKKGLAFLAVNFLNKFDTFEKWQRKLHL